MQPWHARNEIFKSNHHDELSSTSVIWTCTVLSLEKWLGFLETEANPEGPKSSSGPVIAKKFNIAEDLTASKTLSGFANKSSKVGTEGNPKKPGDVDEDDSMVCCCAPYHTWATKPQPEQPAILRILSQDPFGRYVS